VQDLASRLMVVATIMERRFFTGSLRHDPQHSVISPRKVGHMLLSVKRLPPRRTKRKATFSTCIVAGTFPR
jgi:hypothetical protein